VSWETRNELCQSRARARESKVCWDVLGCRLGAAALVTRVRHALLPGAIPRPSLKALYSWIELFSSPRVAGVAPTGGNPLYPAVERCR
jgi:hypothetical protein